MASGYVHSQKNGIDFLNGKAKGYPPNNGFEGEIKTKVLQKGERFDRFGTESGRFVSPEGTPFEMRSLPKNRFNETPSLYEVIKPFEVNSGKIAPYYFQKGGGTQYFLDRSVKWYRTNGYLKRIYGN